MISLDRYLQVYEDCEIDVDNLQWKIDNWKKQAPKHDVDAFTELANTAKKNKDINSFKKALDNCGVSFNDLISACIDDVDNKEIVDKAYILKKIIDNIQ